jgi:glycosyltransferase involved in cell wall biosynthesis
VCHAIEPDRCARCFRESPFHAQLVFGRALARPGAGVLGRAAKTLRRKAPGLVARLGAFASQAGAGAAPTAGDIIRRFEQAIDAVGQFDYVSAPSPSLASEFARLGFPDGRLAVSDYGFPPMTAAPGRGPGRPLRVGFVGTLVWHKGVHVLLEAIRELPAGLVDVRLFGDPDTFPDYTGQLRRAAADLPVTFMGRFDRAGRASIYEQMDVLVVPSLWLENSPLVIHEAFMARVPVVASRIGGIADLVQDGITGVLVEPNAPRELAAALQALATDHERLRALSSAAPPVKSLEQDAERWTEIYRSVVASRTPATAS